LLQAAAKKLTVTIAGKENDVRDKERL
jgi:hypothetical protein